MFHRIVIQQITWKDDKGTIEKKDVILDGYLGTFRQLWSQLKRREKTVPLNVLIGYPSFQQNWQNKFESKQAGPTFEFNESLMKCWFLTERKYRLQEINKTEL
jgi:hypothetical protein